MKRKFIINYDARHNITIEANTEYEAIEIWRKQKHPNETFVGIGEK